MKQYRNVLEDSKKYNGNMEYRDIIQLQPKGQNDNFQTVFIAINLGRQNSLNAYS